jgi:hypothetical protein
MNNRFIRNKKWNLEIGAEELKSPRQEPAETEWLYFKKDFYHLV